MCDHNHDPKNYLARLAPIVVVAGIYVILNINALAKDIVISSGGDSSEVIQNAIDQAASGDRIICQPGVYELNRPLRAKSGVAIIGESRDGTIFRYMGKDQDGMIRLQQVTGVEVATLTLDGSGSRELLYGIHIYQGSRHHIHDLLITNMIRDTGMGPVAIRLNGNVNRIGATDCLIENNVMLGIGVNSKWGGGVRCSWGSSRNIIKNNIIQNTGRGGIFGNDGAAELEIRGNTVSGSGMGSSDALGIEVWNGCDRALIEDNIIDHWLSIDRCDYCAVRRNVVGDGNNDRIAYIGLELAGGSYNIFTDNHVNGGQRVGISSSNNAPKEQVFWARNKIENMAQFGVQIQGDEGGAWNHYFFKNRISGTKNNNPAAKYASVAGQAFRFNKNVWNVTLDSNEIVNNAGTGIQFSSDIDYITLKNNVVSGNGGAAASRIPETARHVQWGGNVVSDNKNNTAPDATGFALRKMTAGIRIISKARVNQPVCFTAHVAANDATALRHLWDFNEGLPASGSEAIHVYGNPGEYVVTLLVWDDAGQGVKVDKFVTVTK
jgi:parallel beta-helix repeat protein